MNEEIVAKVVRLDFSGEKTGQVWGIAAQMPIWRLCFFINSILEVDLKRVDWSEEKIKKSEEELAEDPVLRLFDPNRPPEFMYEDQRVESGVAYRLCSISSKKLPPEARVFQYFLIIYPQDSQLANQAVLSTDSYATLLSVPEIQAVVDLSHIEPLNQLLS